MLFRTYIKDDKEIVELSDEDLKSLSNFYRNYNKIVKSIYGEEDNSIVKITLNDYELISGIENKILLKGEVYYLNYENEKNEEYYFKILGIYNDFYRSEYTLKTITAYFEKDKLMYIGIEYYTLNSFMKDDKIIHFGKRFPKTIESELLGFINNIKDE